MENAGLVLEGGGMRGVYTAGVLDCLLKYNLHIPYVIGVSAGACNGASYISRQTQRSKRININYIRDSRYLSYRNLIKERSIFGMDFLFNKIPYKLEPFDFITFFNSDQRFVMGATDCLTGKPIYFEKNDFTTNDRERAVLTAMQASSSLPFLSRTVDFEGFKLLDGGISDPIPIKKSIQDGNNKNIVILTRNESYRKKPFKQEWLAKRFYPKYIGLIEAMVNR
nr:patatin family protein [Desulfitobacterium hafniense]